jgi:hypothetical protein
VQEKTIHLWQGQSNIIAPNPPGWGLRKQLAILPLKKPNNSSSPGMGFYISIQSLLWKKKNSASISI